MRVVVPIINSRHPPLGEKKGGFRRDDRGVLDDLLNNDDDGRMMIMNE